MLSIISCWILAILIFTTFGNILTTAYKSFNKTTQNYGISDNYFLGICFVNTILALFSLWFPVNNTIIWGLLLICALYNIYSYKFFDKKNVLSDVYNALKSLPVSCIILIILISSVVLIYSLLPPLVYDTQLYYIQSIMWNELYRVIPGLGNLHGRFGFNSNFLLLSSGFTLKDIFGFRSFGLLGISAIVLFGWVIKQGFSTGSLWKKIGLYFFCFAFLFLYRRFISSPSTDPLPNMMVAFVLLRFVLANNSFRISPLIFWIIPVFSLTLKLSVVPVCILTLLVFIDIIKEKEYKNLIFLLISGLMIIVPWCTRNIILTGYLIYPYPAIDLFDFDWKIARELVEIEKGWVSSWAKMPGKELSDFMNNTPFTEWTAVWLLRHIKHFPFFTFTFVLAGISPLVVFGLYKRKCIENFYSLVPWIIAVVGSVFWFFMAPDVRFGYSFILMSFIIPVLMIDIPVKNSISSKLVTGCFFISILYLGIISKDYYKETVGDKPLASYLYAPQSFIFMKGAFDINYIPYQVGNITIYRSSHGFCFDDCFPCIESYHHGLEMRSENIKDGFRVKNNK